MDGEIVMRRRVVVGVMAAVVGTTTGLAGQGPPAGRVQALPVTADDAMRVATVQAGTKWELRLLTPLDSATAKADQRFEAATLVDHAKDGRVLIPAATIVRGFVGSVLASNPSNRGGNLTLAFDEIRMSDKAIRFRATVEQLFKGQPSETTARVGTDAAIEAALSRLPGGGQGSLVGVLVGPGGSIASTEAGDVKLVVGTIMRVRIDRAIEITALAAR